MSQVTPFLSPIPERPENKPMRMVRKKLHGVNQPMNLVRKKRKLERQRRKNAR